MYLASDEFLDLERARLTLRAHGIGVDRGRLVREAIALLMTDLEAGIDASVIAKRLRGAGQPGPADCDPAAAGAAVGNGAPVSGGPADGVLVGAPANDVPVDCGFVNGVLAGGASVNRGPVAGGPVAGVLANGIGFTGPPEGPQ